MKNILRISFLSVIIFFSACDSTDLDLLDSPNGVSPENAEIDFFFNQIQLDFTELLVGTELGQAATPSVNDMTSRYVRMIAMSGGNVYENAYGPERFNYIWRTAYADLLPDIEATLALADGLTLHSGACKLMKAHTLMTLVDLFGDVPYTEIGQGLEVISPKTDTDSDVYATALGLINEAIADFGTPARADIANDLFFPGIGNAEDRGAAWTKVANSLKLRYYVNTRLVETDATTEINALIDGGNLIASGEDDFQFNYGTNRTNPDSRHPSYAEGYESGPNDYQSNYYMWTMFGEGTAEDPRLRYYFYRQDCDVTDENQFTLSCATSPRPLHYTGPYPWCVASEDGYWGRDHGDNDGIPPDDEKRTVYGLYPAGGQFDSGQCASSQNEGKDGAKGEGINPIMLSSFVDFMLAESALTLGTTGDARAYLENGVQKSIDKVLGFSSRADVDESLVASDSAYIEAVLLSYDSADAAGKLEIVIKEYRKALWGNGLEAFNAYRRTGFPSNMQPTRDLDSGNFPRTFFYPADFVNLNSNASQKTITQQVFWDTNAAGFIN